MSEWWTYTLSDFLLFSPRTYQRLLELHNVAIWPSQIASLVAGLATVALLLAGGPRAGRTIALVLAAAWSWVAWAFHDQRYAQINWAASWLAAAFALQSALLLIAGAAGRGVAIRGGPGVDRRIAAAIALSVVVGYPLLALLGGRSWTAAEVFGATGDPTALATLALLSQVRGPVRWLLMPIPLAACVVAVATQAAMDAPEAIVAAALALASVALAMRRRDGLGSTA